MTWKNTELVRAQVELVKAGVRVTMAGGTYFGADDIPDSVTFDGQGIVGSALHALRSAHVIEDYWGHHPEQGIVHGRRKSRRESANGRKVSLYRLCSMGAAREFFIRHEWAVEDEQRQLAL